VELGSVSQGTWDASRWQSMPQAKSRSNMSDEDPAELRNAIWVD
jgi:hypothetical protein